MGDQGTQQPVRPASFWRRLTSHMQPTTFFGSAAFVVLFVLYCAVFSDFAKIFFQEIQSRLTTSFGWFYILSATMMLGFVVWLLLSRYGSIRLGPPDATPEFSYFTWFAMMLAAGMGIGVVFYGVAEPIQHYANPPMAEAETPEALRESMAITFFHWGFHPWAIYSAIALPLAFFHFRHKLPLAPRSLLYPLIGDRIYGFRGHAVDILCTVGTLFGVATSLGLGSKQINAGLQRIADVEISTDVQLILIVVITGAATISVVTGLKAGIRRLSQMNIILAAFIMVFVFLVGPSLYSLDLFVTSIGSYLERLPFLSFHVNPGSQDGWQSSWTLFYWSWWISWSPFVGVFTARISRGRTIREYITAALLVPSVMGFLWFSVLGGTALHQQITEGVDLASVVAQEPALSLYTVLDRLPLSSIMAVLATLLIVIFFVTSSDSGSFVDDMVTSGGDPNPPRAQRVFWALSEGAVAASLLLAGGLQALRTASLTTGLPMAVFLLVACWGMAKGVQRDYAAEGLPTLEKLKGERENPDE